MERKVAATESLQADSRQAAGQALGQTTGQSANQTVFAILAALSFCHFLNDMMQSLLPAIYPMLKTNYALSFTQVGLLTLTFQGTASLF